MPEPTIEARFLGGAYDGQTEMVPADEDKLLGTVPALRTIRRMPPPDVNPVFGAAPLDVDTPRILYYDCQHRGGEWVYVLHGADPTTLPEKTDPLLEVLVAHIRREWPNRTKAGVREVVHAAVREQGGAELERYVERGVLRKLHAEIDAHGGTVSVMDGPRWDREDDFTWLVTVTATVLPRFGQQLPPSPLAAPHEGDCCPSCVSDVEQGYQTYYPDDPCCCRAARP